MIQASLIAVSALAMLGADKPGTVDYRLSVAPEDSGPPAVSVEVRLRGDADGETRIVLPHAALSGLAVSGASTSAPDTGLTVLRHRPGARLTLRYRLRSEGPGPNQLAMPGAVVFAVPEGRPDEPVTLRWARVPKGWRALSDLDSGATARAPKITDLATAVVMAGSNLQITERMMPGGTLQVAAFGNAGDAARLAELAAPLVSAQRAFWLDAPGAFLVAAGFKVTAENGQNLMLPADILSRSDPSDLMAQTLTRSWIPQRLGAPAASASGIMDGLAGFYADRIRLRAGLLPHNAAVSTLAMADTRGHAGSRGAILVLKWDEDIRRKSAGKLNLDDVVLRMRDHYQRFSPGQGPDVITGLVSAAWVTAGIDLRPDIARYAAGGAVIPLPETMFDGCLDARVTVSPGFDAGFDAAGSFTAKAVRGVRRGGPAWNGGLRNGMALDSWAFSAGDMTREIVLAVRPTGKRARLRTIRFWPYGDVDVETRKLQMAVGLSETATTACARKIGGL